MRPQLLQPVESPSLCGSRSKNGLWNGMMLGLLLRKRCMGSGDENMLENTMCLCCVSSGQDWWSFCHYFPDVSFCTSATVCLCNFIPTVIEPKVFISVRKITEVLLVFLRSYFLGLGLECDHFNMLPKTNRTPKLNTAAYDLQFWMWKTRAFLNSTY